MKLAEVLIMRADANKRIQQLRERLNRSAKVQEGDNPPENPQELMEELERVVTEFRRLVKLINRTNSQTTFGDGMSLTDALADRDALALERSVLAGLIDAAAGNANDYRYAYVMRDVKTFRAVDVSAVQKRVDELARRHRELDTRIQALNWSVDVVE